MLSRDLGVTVPPEAKSSKNVSNASLSLLLNNSSCFSLCNFLEIQTCIFATCLDFYTLLMHTHYIHTNLQYVVASCDYMLFVFEGQTEK